MALDPQAPPTEEPVRRYDTFVALVSNLASLSLPEAELALRAVIETLAEHLSEDERRTVAARLPKAVKPWLTEPGAGEELRHAAFFHRVAEREGIVVGPRDRVALQTAERHIRAVFDVLRLVLLPHEIDELAERLPDQARRLLRPSEVRPRAIIDADSFVEHVARAGRFDLDRAWRATEAVLETLGERLAEGEVSDLEALLPGEFRPALELGKLHSGGKASRFDVDEFVGRVADRVGETSHDEALDDARFVFRALRERLPERELDDILAELPSEYDDLIGR